MSLPATDNFNRANANPIGGSWTTVPGKSDIAIVSSAATSGGAEAVAYWNADTFAADHYSQAIVPTDGSAMGLMVRMSTTQWDGYLLYLNGSGTVAIYRVTNGSAAGIANPNFAYTGSDVIKFEAVGTALTPYKNGVAQTGTTDANFTTGQAGIYAGGTSGTLDNWEGGNNFAGASCTPTVGAEILTGVAPSSVLGTLLTPVTP